MEMYKKILLFFIIILILFNSTIFQEVPPELKKWIMDHPEFYMGNFFYLDKKNNKIIGMDELEGIEELAKWWYYDTKEKEVKPMPGSKHINT